MIEKVSKYRLLIISIFLVIWSIAIESPYQKGGIDNFMHYVIFFITILIAIFYLLPYSYPKLIFAEKIIYSIISASLGLAISLIATNSILEILYGIDYQLKSINLVSNGIFYLVANIISIGLLTIMLKLKLKGTDSQPRI